MKAPTLTLAALLLLAACQSPKNARHSYHEWRVQAPAGEQYCHVDPAGETIIPNGRIVKPMGRTVRIAPHPYGLALSPDGSVAVTANSGNRPFSITILENPASGQPKVRQVPEGALNDPNLLEDVFMGVAITPDNRSVWVAGGSVGLRSGKRSSQGVSGIACGACGWAPAAASASGSASHRPGDSPGSCAGGGNFSLIGAPARRARSAFLRAILADGTKQ